MLIVVGMAVAFGHGCRAHPMSLAIMVVGDAVDDADVQDRKGKLVGQEVAAADAMFGARLESLWDTKRMGREMIIYPVQGDLLGANRYVVEAYNGNIVGLSKTKRNIDGVEDVIKSADLRMKLLGKKPFACNRLGKLGRPILVLRSRTNELLVRVYDVRNATNLRGARYCVLRFDENDRCQGINLVGVSASTQYDPAT